MKFNFSVFILLFCALCGFSIHASADDTASLDEAYETKFMQEFVVLVNESKDMGDFLKRNPFLTGKDLVYLRTHFDMKRKMPKAVYKNGALQFDDQIELKIISLNNHDFRINGRYYKYDSLHKNFAQSAQEIQKLLNRKQSAKWLWPLGLVQNLFAKKETPAEEPADEEDDKKLLYYDSDWEHFKRDPLVVGDNAMFGWAVISPVAAMDWTDKQARAALAKSCDEQVKDLNAILEENKIALESTACGTNHRGNDRKLTFWTPTTKGKEPGEKSFSADFASQTLKEDGVDRMMFFNYDSLEEVRELKTGKDGRLSRVDHKGEDGEFKKAKKDIEPYRKVLHYIGTNYTCTKCARELRAQVATSKPPAYLNSTAAKSSAAARDGAK